MSKGDIVLIDFPFTDLSGQKARPALILYSGKGGDDGIFAFITSDRPKRNMQFDIKLKKSKLNGLKVNSIIKLDKIATLNKKMAIRHLGQLESTYMKEIGTKLKRLFGL